MKSSIANLLIALPLAGMIGVGVVQAETFSGKLNGHGCAHGGHTCPADKLDPHLQYEPDFVLQKSDGTYYFLRNVPRDTKVRYVLEEVKASGKLNPKYNSIVVDEFMVKNGGNYKTVWSQRAQDDAYDYIYGDGWFQFSGATN